MKAPSAHPDARCDTRGGVYVEFLIAFLPVFAFFLCMRQLSLLFSAKLIVEHAAVQGARSAAVVFGDEPGPYGETSAETNTMTKKRRQVVRDAVLVSLAPLILDGSVASVDVAYPPPDKPGGKDQSVLSPMTLGGTSMIRVRVEAEVVCKIAIANAIACGGLRNGLRGAVGFARVRKMTSESLYPYQGARYVYE
jgi:hypothetical protein